MTRTMRTLVVALAVSAFLIVAPTALAGTIRYTIDPSTAYTIQDNGNGIVKVTYNGCVTAGALQQLSFQMVTNVSADGSATFNILKEEGENPTATFTPPSVELVKGPDQTFNIALAFSIPSQNNDVTTFRIKLDPASGEGLGEGAGIMVSVPCVLAAGATEGTGAQSPPATSSETLAAPTAGLFPGVKSVQARGASPCVAVQRTLRVRAGKSTLVRAVVRVNGQLIQGSAVRVVAPGFRKTRRSNSQGVAEFRVKPTRSGTLYIQADACFGADKVDVLAARVGDVRSQPRFTG